MAEPVNGNGHQTVVSSTFKLGSQMMGLAPQFMALLALNVLMLGLLYWFVDARARHTAELLQQLLSSCLERGS